MNEQATKMAREAALAWRMSTDDKQPHDYSEVLHGLAALLVSVGYVHTPKGTGGWSDSVAGLLSSAFHWPLASYNLRDMTVEQIVRGVCEAYTPCEIGRERAFDDRHWMEPRCYTNDVIEEKCADFNRYAREIQTKLDALKISRRGTKKWKSFYNTNRDYVLSVMAAQVNTGIVAVEDEYKAKADKIRSEYMPKLDRWLASESEREAVLRKLCEAVDKPFPEPLVKYYDDVSTTYARRKKAIEHHCSWLVSQARTEDVDSLVREACKRRPELAPFVCEEMTK